MSTAPTTPTTDLPPFLDETLVEVLAKEVVRLRVENRRLQWIVSEAGLSRDIIDTILKKPRPLWATTAEPKPPAQGW